MKKSTYWHFGRGFRWYRGKQLVFPEELDCMGKHVSDHFELMSSSGDGRTFENSFDALRYAQGPIVSVRKMLKVKSENRENDTRTKRMVFALADASGVLQYFSLWCASEVLGLVGCKHEECILALEAKNDWLSGIISDDDMALERKKYGDNKEVCRARGTVWSAIGTDFAWRLAHRALVEALLIARDASEGDLDKEVEIREMFRSNFEGRMFNLLGVVSH